MTTPQDPNQHPQPEGSYPPPTGEPQQPNQHPQPEGSYPPPTGEPQQPNQYQPPTYPQPGYPQSAGQQPGYPQSAGQQPGEYQQPGAYPPPTGAPQQPAMPGMVGGAEPTKKSNTPKIIIAVVVVLAVVLGGVLYFVNRQSDPAAASVGDCIKVVDDSATDAKLDRLDCDKPDALYKVTATGVSTTCDENEATYTEREDADDPDSKATTKLCLQPNVSDGECIRPTDEGGNGMEKVDCATTKGDEVFKVVKFDHTTSDPSVCPGDSIPAQTFKTHPGVLCVAENN